MSKNNTVVAVYGTHEEAEHGVMQLRTGGVDMRTLSIVGKDTHTDEQVVGFYNTGDRMKSWGGNGAMWGGFWGFLVGAAYFAVPGLGPILAAGPVVGWIVGALEGAITFGGLGVIGAGLASIGIPENTIIDYENVIRTDHFLLIVHGAPAEVEKARAIIEATRPSRTAVHQAELAASAR